jgi:bud site selection protein 31
VKHDRIVAVLMASALARLTKKAPEGWDIILPQLETFDNRMKDAVNESHEGKRKHESTWPIHRIHFEKSRYVYELYYNKQEISKEL